MKNYGGSLLPEHWQASEQYNTLLPSRYPFVRYLFALPCCSPHYTLTGTLLRQRARIRFGDIAPVPISCRCSSATRQSNLSVISADTSGKFATCSIILSIASASSGVKSRVRCGMAVDCFSFSVRYELSLHIGIMPLPMDWTTAWENMFRSI